MTFALSWQNKIIPGYYYDTLDNTIYRQSSKPASATRYDPYGPYIMNKPDKPVSIIRDKYGKLVCNINGIYRRIDWIIASTAYGYPQNIIRVIHLDNDPDNYNWENLRWFTQEDVIKEYLDEYNVEKIEDIPEIWKEYRVPLNDRFVFNVSNTGHVSREGRPFSFKTDNDGYLFTYYTDADGHDTHVLFLHRMVAELFVNNPNPEKYKYVNHLDGDKQNCAFWNLMWCDLSENRNHATLNGLYLGKVNDEEMIEELCQCLAAGVSVKEICDIFHVNPKFVSSIYTGRRWSRISSKYTFPQNGWTKSTKDRVKNYIIEGKKGIDIADALHLVYDNRFISMYERMRRELIRDGLIEKHK